MLKATQRRDLPRHLTAFAGLLAALTLAACAPAPTRAAPSTPPLPLSPTPTDTAASQAMARVIAGEFALRREQPRRAALDYMGAARVSQAPWIARRAMQLALQAGDVELAEASIERLRALDVGSRELALARARLALLRGQREAAERQFELLLAGDASGAWKDLAAALATAPGRALAGEVLMSVAQTARLPADESVWVDLSQLSAHLGRLAWARTLADAAVQRFHGAAGMRWAATLRRVAGDTGSARALYAQGVALHPRDVALRLGYAALLADAGHWRDAQRLLAHGPQTHATWAARTAYAARAKDEVALRALYVELQAVDVVRRTDNAFLLGQLAEFLHRDDEALAWYAQVLPDDARAFDADARQVVLLDKAGRRSEAAARVLQLERDYPGDPQNLRLAYQLDALLHSRRDEYAAAVAVYDRALAALPDDPALLYNRGIAHSNAGRIDAAVADFRRVLALAPDNVEAKNALGFTLADADRDLPEAGRLLRAALAAEPDAVAIIDSWGWLQYRLGNLDAARDTLQRAWSRQRDPDIGAHLAEVLWQSGQREQARELFGMVRRIDPRNATLLGAERRLRP